LGIEKIVPKVWDLVQPQLRDELSQPKALRNRERDAIAKVFDGLIHTGFAMQEYFDSRPASGADHLMSHVWEMNECCMIEGKAVSHGFKVAIGTLASTALMEELLTMDKALVLLAIENAKPLSWEERKAEIRSYVSSSSIQDRQIEICKKKFLEGPALVERKKMIVEHWDELKEKVGTQIIPFAELRERFSLAGCPVEPVTIALSYEDFRYGMRVAQMMRNRYTILDLVYELGLMDYMIEKISDPKPGYFHEYRNR
jgi:glycerol-1-phosphate dehydrogenase [NAD(P)+]